MNSKIVTVNALLILLGKQYKNKKTGIITGCFDVLHTGHIDLFQFAKKYVDVLIVGIDTDAAIKKTKGGLRPINTQKERARMLAAIVYVDNVLLLSNKHAFSSQAANNYYDDLILKLKPNHLITARSSDSYWNAKKERMEKAGGTLLIYNGKQIISTSSLAAKIIAIE